MSIQNQPADIAILGGGPGGYVAALSAAQRGASVTLVEKNRVGGTCLNVGCIPTKVLTMATELLLKSKRASEFGLSIPQAGVDLPGLMNYKRSTVDQLVSGVEQLLKARRVTLLQGEGRIIRPDMLLVDDGQGGKQEVLAKQIILAPGSVTAELPLPGRELLGVVTSAGALDIDAVPPSLIVIGGGVIGLEFACIYEALGSKVTILEMTPSILPVGTDEVIAKRLQIILRRHGMSIQTGVTVERIEKAAETLQVCATGAGGEQVFQGERVLVATGRSPNTHAMGFDEIGLRHERSSHRRR